MQLQHKRGLDLKNREKEEEQEHLAKVREELELEKTMKEEKLKQWKQEAAKVVFEKQQAKLQASKAKSYERQEYVKMAEDRSKKECDQEQLYKDYFKKCDEDIKFKQNIHENVVNTIEKRKKQKFADWEKQWEAEYMAKQQDKEEREKFTRLKASKDTGETLKLQIEKRDKERDDYKRNYTVRAQENLRVGQEVSGEMQKSRENKLIVQQKYREFLEMQLKAAPRTTPKLKGESFDSGLTMSDKNVWIV